MIYDFKGSLWRISELGRVGHEWEAGRPGRRQEAIAGAQMRGDGDLGQGGGHGR